MTEDSKRSGPPAAPVPAPAADPTPLDPATKHTVVGDISRIHFEDVAPVRDHVDGTDSGVGAGTGTGGGAAGATGTTDVNGRRTGARSGEKRAAEELLAVQLSELLSSLSSPSSS